MVFSNVGSAGSLTILSVSASDSLHERFFVVFGTDTVERHRVVRCVVGFKKWVLSAFYLYIFFIHTRRIAIDVAKIVKILHIGRGADANLTYIRLGRRHSGMSFLVAVGSHDEFLHGRDADDTSAQLNEPLGLHVVQCSRYFQPAVVEFVGQSGHFNLEKFGSCGA